MGGDPSLVSEVAHITTQPPQQMNIKIPIKVPNNVKSISSLGLIGSIFSENQSSWQGQGCRAFIKARGEDGRGAGGVGKESQGGTLGCLGAIERPGDSGGDTQGPCNQAGGQGQHVRLTGPDTNGTCQSVGEKIFQCCQPPATTTSPPSPPYTGDKYIDKVLPCNDNHLIPPPTRVSTLCTFFGIWGSSTKNNVHWDDIRWSILKI